VAAAGISLFVDRSASSRGLQIPGRDCVPKRLGKSAAAAAEIKPRLGGCGFGPIDRVGQKVDDTGATRADPERLGTFAIRPVIDGSGLSHAESFLGRVTPETLIGFEADLQGG